MVTAGQVNDVTQALPVLSDLRPGTVIGDKAYDADALPSLPEDELVLVLGTIGS